MKTSDFGTRSEGGAEDTGASAAAIRAHYDVGNRFYRAWLDDSMTYSCALWRDGEGPDQLGEAQARKLDCLIDWAGAIGAGRVLDVGCGWGSGLRRLVEEHGVERAVGLTLSPAQSALCPHDDPRVTVLLEGWADHAPTTPYDAMICIGALEHFVRPEDSPEARMAVYRSFFSKCRAWLTEGGTLSLQTMAYGSGSYTAASPVSAVFPQSDLPRLSQLAVASDGLFAIEELHDHRAHYSRTVSAWLRNLEAHRSEVTSIVGGERYDQYRRYLRAGVKGFDSGVFQLLRLRMKRSG